MVCQIWYHSTVAVCCVDIWHNPLAYDMYPYTVAVHDVEVCGQYFLVYAQEIVG